MGKSTKTAPAPPAPDPYAVAAAQTGSNVDTATANSYIQNANVYGPTGSTEYAQTGWKEVGGHIVPQFSQYNRLSDTQQHLYDQQVSLGSQLNDVAGQQISRVGNTLGAPIDLGGLPSTGNLPTAPTLQQRGFPVMLGGYGRQDVATSFDPTSRGVSYGDTSFAGTPDQRYSIDGAGQIQDRIDTLGIGQARQQVQDALMQRLNPQLQQSRDALDTQLRNQGLVPGTEAYNAAIDAAGRQENDARLAVIAQAGTEEDRLFGQQATQGQFANSAQNQRYGQNANDAAFYNSAASTAFGQAKDRGLFGLGAIAQNNQAQGQEFDQLGQRAAFSNAGIAQNEQSRAAQIAFNNQVHSTNMDNLNAYTDYGNQIAQQDFGNETSLFQLGATARERALQEQLATRNQSINETSALMNGGQVSMPQFTQYQSGQVAGTPVGQYVYNSAQLNQDAWKTQVQDQRAQQQQSAQMWGSLFGLGGSLAGAGAYYAKSDRRLKRDIKPIGVRTSKGFRLYRYRMTGETRFRIGVMADEVKARLPAAVRRMADGYDAVNYAMVA